MCMMSSSAAAMLLPIAFAKLEKDPNQSRKCATNNFWTKNSAGRLG